MGTNQFIYNNINIKKIDYGRKEGFIRIQLYDYTYNKVFDCKADLSNKKEVKRLFGDLENKGCKLFKETSWF